MTKTQKLIYWIATLWLALGMTSTGIVQLMRMKDDVDRTAHLGYPTYLLTILGIWKLLGVAAVLFPKLPVLKEWAYAGFFFAMSGALISHVVVSDPFSEIAPSLLLLILTVVSWHFRPESRRVANESI
ncbi:MAG: DoxX family protein [Acidobacteriota bacterium]